MGVGGRGWGAGVTHSSFSFFRVPGGSRSCFTFVLQAAEAEAPPSAKVDEAPDTEMVQASDPPAASLKSKPVRPSKGPEGRTKASRSSKRAKKGGFLFFLPNYNFLQQNLHLLK